MQDLMTAHLARLDDAVLTAIIASSSSQSAYLARFRGDAEAAAMSAVTGIIAVAAESALIAKRCGIAI
jgi:hypothetical protein